MVAWVQAKFLANNNDTLQMYQGRPLSGQGKTSSVRHVAVHNISPAAKIIITIYYYKFETVRRHVYLQMTGTRKTSSNLDCYHPSVAPVYEFTFRLATLSAY